MKWLTQWAITSSALILIVLAARYFLREKLSARWRYALWAVVLVRLLVPFQVELPAKVSESVPLVASNLAPTVDQWEERSIPVFPQNSRPVDEFNGITFELLEPGEIKSTEAGMGCWQRSQDGETVTWYLDVWSPAQIVEAIWDTGAVLMTLVLLASNLHFALRLRRSRKPLVQRAISLNCYIAPGLPSPCLFGVLRPAVYVTPEAADNPGTLHHVLAHELTHYAHKDHIWSLLRCLALALHWYNPLVWLAVILSKSDAELACDEGAVARLGEAERIPYGRTLVDMVAARSLRPADLLSCSTAMTGGKKSIQERVARLVKKTETVKTALFAAAAVIALAVVFVFAGREEAAHTEFDVFLAQVEAAQSIFVGNPFISSQMPPPAISDPELLAQAKNILSKAMPIFKVDDKWIIMSLSSDSTKHPEPITQEELERQFIIAGYRLNLYPTADQDLDTADGYFLISWDNYCLLTQWYPEREENTVEVVAALPGDTINRLRALAQQQNYRIEAPSAFDQYLSQVENAAALYYYNPSPFHADELYPNPIADEDLLPNAKVRLSDFISMDQLPDRPELSLKGAEYARQITVCPALDKAGGQTYRLLFRDGYTYLLSLEEDAVLARSAEPDDVAEYIQSLARKEYNRSL